MPLSRSLISTTATSILAALLLGCRSGDGFSPEPPTLLSPPSKQATADAVTSIQQLVDRYNAPTASPSVRKDARNEIIDKVMQIIDSRYMAFDEDIWKNRNLTDFAFDMTNIALGFTGTITGGTETKTVTNALVTVITGAKTGISSDFYNQQTAMAVSQKMKALRSAQAAILINHRDDTDEKYPLAPDALQDLTTYYRDGTVLGALQEISSTAGATTNTNTNVTKFLQSGGVGVASPATGPNVPATGPGVRAIVKPGGKWLLMRDSFGVLHVFGQNGKEVKFNDAGIPAFDGQGSDPTGSTNSEDGSGTRVVPPGPATTRQTQ